MKQALADALASKKFLAYLTTILVVVGNKIVGHFGYELDASQVALLVGAGAAYIVGQGLQDHGESAAKVNAASVASMDAQGPKVLP